MENPQDMAPPKAAFGRIGILLWVFGKRMVLAVTANPKNRSSLRGHRPHRRKDVFQPAGHAKAAVTQ